MPLNSVFTPPSERLSRRGLLARAAAAGLGASIEGILPSAVAWAASETAAKPAFVVLQPNDISGLDPLACTQTSDITVSFNLFDTLVRRHPDGTLHAALATAWTRTAPTTWQLTLRPGVRFHDGTRFTSRDAKYSLDRTFVAVKAARLKLLFQTLDRTEAPDRETLVIHTKRPDPLIPAKLAFCGQVVPWAYVERVGFSVFNERPVGTGPFRFVSWTKGDRCVLAANPDYWDGRPAVERVVVRPVSEPWARVDRLFRGGADLITRLAPEHSERVASHPATRVVGALYAGLYVLLVNVWVAPLNDARVRQALSLAIDRSAIVRDLWRGRGVVPSGPIPRGDDHYDGALPPLPYDPQGARTRLQQAGYRGEPVIIETTDGLLANDKPMTEMIAEMWEDVGVNVVVEVIDSEARLRKYRSQTFKGLAWSDPTSTTREPDGLMGRLLAPDTPHDYWRNPEFDRLAMAARFTGDERVRDEAYRRMTALFLEHNPWIVILQPYEDYGLRRHVEFTPSPDEQVELRPFNLRMRRS